MNLPSYALLKLNYPTESNGEWVKQQIGGDVTQSWLGSNTCVIRMAKAFNYVPNHQIPCNHPGLETVRGGDKKCYAFRVSQFISFLRWKYGPPNISKSGDEIKIDAFTGKTGIIAWHISGWSDATGHFTLWDGSAGLYEGSHHYFQDFPTHAPPAGQPRGLLLTSVDLWTC